MKVKVYLRICLADIWIGEMKSFKTENWLQLIFYVRQNSLDTTMCLLYQMKINDSL